jgi:hemerythrin-like domain-containing protein
MPVVIGQKPDHDFSQPVGMLSDCHRRVERFLGVLVRLSSGFEGQPLNEESRAALSGALRYFQESAPKHTADEEESLFPRLRKIADAELAGTLAEMERLEEDHRRVAPLHDEMDTLGRRWLDAGQLSPDDAERLKNLTAFLESHYREHIRTEDERLFPAAERALSETDRRAIGQEMAERRGVGHKASQIIL